MDKGWSEENLARVADFWREGISASVIAMRMRGSGLSRNAILGKMIRGGIPHGETLRRSQKPTELGFRFATVAKGSFVFTPGHDQAIITAVNRGGIPQWKIADETGCSLNELTARIAALRNYGFLGPAARKGADWSEEDVENLKRLDAEDIPHGTIAHKIGRTYYAVVSKLSKLGLLKAKEPGGGQRNLYRIKGKSTPKAVAVYRDKPDPYAPAPQLDERGARFTFLTATRFSCRWPHGNPATADFHICGQAREPGSSYCAYHKARASGGKPGRTAA